jgi:hypothetical protein
MLLGVPVRCDRQTSLHNKHDIEFCSNCLVFPISDIGNIHDIHIRKRPQSLLMQGKNALSQVPGYWPANRNGHLSRQKLKLAYNLSTATAAIM